MQVLTNNKSNNIQFQSSQLIKELTRVIPDTKVCKNLTVIDKRAFHSYIYTMQFKIKTTAEEIKNLFSFDGDEFFNKAYHFLAQKLNIPEELIPPIIHLGQDNPERPCAYSPAQNVIIRNKDLSQFTKPQIYNIIRHELQHFLQNMSVLRHEIIGDIAVDKYSVQKAEQIKEGFKNLLKQNLAVEDFKSIAGEDLWSVQVYSYLKDLKDKNGTVDVDKELEGVDKEFKPYIEALKKMAIDKMGMIKNDSKEGEKAEACFNDFCNIGYYNSDGKIDMYKYVNSFIEYDALMAGEKAEFELNKDKECFFKKLKDAGLAVEKAMSKEQFEIFEQSVLNNKK